MISDPSVKYHPIPRIDIADRAWPEATIKKAPTWCSVDLRDGNQALIAPMNLEQKIEMFKLLCSIGFKEIEVGFPSASKVEYDFIRHLIDQDLIPEDVTIQVLTQCREHLIRSTVEAVRGTKQAIIHIYNSTSILQRKVVFKLDKPQIKKIAIDGTKLVRELIKTIPETKVTLEYSPESFTGTEIDYAVEVCNAVVDTWEPTANEKVILNLPSTVEMSSPNVYADQIEWFSRRIKNRDKVIISLHTHNDRGCGVAATELGMLAGAERVEGTLFGNGERTGNVDIVTLALNLYSQGVHPQLDFSNLPYVAAVCERITQIPLHPRHPYAGELVFTAFSGSHQDAINKGMIYSEESGTGEWSVPYIPIDPQDIGRSYEGIVRINSQSGKGGIAYMMRSEHGLNLPKPMHPEFGKIVQKTADEVDRELTPEEIWDLFNTEYIEATSPLAINDFTETGSTSTHKTTLSFDLEINGVKKAATGYGNGPLDAFVNAVKDSFGIQVNIADYSQHALAKGADAEAVSYVAVSKNGGNAIYGVGCDSNITLSGLKAVASAINRAIKLKAVKFS